ncbi:sodium:calcium antiporter [Halioglobus maricola]|uniref:Sodium:calcium antiporter n=1 Tax=Halioglobus maricola TaxID=2601894 RepID=A0A5P9NLD6_9GAMM|nr:sodium:calcium antiporter [Halioglobus maricola]QFU76325.1 sodium:calcium antiporter [Halioglobus maricola]
MLDLFLLVVGLAGLWAGSELLVNAAISIADRFRLSDAYIGMVVLAIGTDLPEIFVAADASIHTLAGEDFSHVVIGSAVGSSMGQLGLVLGIAGCFGFASRPFRRVWRNALFLLGGLAALALFSVDGVISRLQGWALIGCYAAYLASLALWRPAAGDTEPTEPSNTPSRDLVYLLVGFCVLLVAAELTVTHAVSFAAYVGLSQLSVSAVIIGLGSSLPELSVSLIALWRGRGGLSVGNLLGSNVLDTLLVPGIGAAIAPLIVPPEVLFIDIPMLALVTTLALGFLYASPRGIKMPEALLLLSIYLLYVGIRLTA